MDTTRLLATVLAALALNEFVHICFEVWGIKQKVTWLKHRMDSKPHGSWPIHIDTFAKTILLHTILFIVSTGGFTALLLVTHPSTATLLSISIVTLVITYAFTTIQLDAYHSEIGKLLARYKRH